MATTPSGNGVIYLGVGFVYIKYVGWGTSVDFQNNVSSNKTGSAGSIKH